MHVARALERERLADRGTERHCVGERHIVRHVDQEDAADECQRRDDDRGHEAVLVKGVGLAERERVGLGAALEERDLQCPLADRVVLAHELVEAAVPEQAVPSLVDVNAE
jgi:hypothetical protein